MPVIHRGPLSAFLRYRIDVSPTDDGEAVLTAWWPETMCSLLPCPIRLEQWSDGGWRVAGTRTPHDTADAAARAYLNYLMEQNEERAERWRIKLGG